MIDMATQHLLLNIVVNQNGLNLNVFVEVKPYVNIFVLFNVNKACFMRLCL